MFIVREFFITTIIRNIFTTDQYVIRYTHDVDLNATIPLYAVSFIIDRL
jgi:hypothetical protein